MPSPFDRRQFLRHGLTIVGGALLLPTGLSALGTPASRLLKSQRERILELIAAFGRNATYRGATVAAIMNGRAPVVSELQAELTDFAALSNVCSCWRAHGLEFVRASGSRLTVLASGHLFDIDALPTQEFAIARASAASNAVFAHDALSLTPGSNQAVDPLGAGKTLRLIRQSSGPAALDDILRGRIDAAESGLMPDAAFQRTEANVLAQSVFDVTAADGFARVFFAHVTALVNALPAHRLTAIATSPLITSALRTRLGVEAEAIAQTAKRSAGARGAPGSPAALWLAGGLATEIQAGRGPRWIATNSLARLVASTAALAEAQSFVATGTAAS